ncbi:MAG: ECF-type sigma factor [Planctomycetota bacterium]
MAGEAERDATQILHSLTRGDTSALSRLMPLVYDELHALAAQCLAKARPDQTLQPTALVHEAYLRLIDQSRVRWESAAHFLAVAAQAMQRVLVDHLRNRHARKRGGDWRKITLAEDVALSRERDVDVLALDEALTELAALDERQSQIVVFRFFGGMRMEEVAQVLGISKRTVEEDWRMARAWLHWKLTRGQTTEDGGGAAGST